MVVAGSPDAGGLAAVEGDVGVAVGVDSESVTGADGTGVAGSAPEGAGAEGALEGSGVAGRLAPVLVAGSWVVSEVICVTCVSVGLGPVAFWRELAATTGTAEAVEGTVVLAVPARCRPPPPPRPPRPLRLAELTGWERWETTTGSLG